MEASAILNNYLKENSAFTPEEIALTSSFFQFKYLVKEEVLFGEGTQFAKIVFVAEGILCSYIYDDYGQEIIKTFISPLDFFAEIDSFEKGTPCAFNVKAIIPCKLLTLSKSDAEKLTKQVTGWELAMKNEAVKAMNSMIRKQEFLNMGEAAEKYRYFVKTFPELAQKVPLKYIASYLQITQSSLSRIRRKGW